MSMKCRCLTRVQASNRSVSAIWNRAFYIGNRGLQRGAYLKLKCESLFHENWNSGGYLQGKKNTEEESLWEVKAMSL